MVRAAMEKLVIFHYDDGSRSGQTIRNLLATSMDIFKVTDTNLLMCLMMALMTCALLPVWPISEDTGAGTG